MFGLVLPYIHCGSILKAPVAFTHPSAVGGQGPAAVPPPSQCGRTPPPQRTPPNAPPSMTSPATSFSSGPRPSHRIRTTRPHDRRGTVGGLGTGCCSVKTPTKGNIVMVYILYVVMYIIYTILYYNYYINHMIYYVIWLYGIYMPQVCHWVLFGATPWLCVPTPSPGWRDVECFTPFRSSRRDMAQQLHCV